MRDTNKNWEVGCLVMLIPFTVVFGGTGVWIVGGIIYAMLHRGPMGPTGKALTAMFLIVAAVLLVPTIALWIVFFGSKRNEN